MSPDELEDLLPDLLYGELDEDRAADVRAQIEQSDELAKKLASYEALRGAFKELPDEEPPSFITAQLLHEAAKQAPASTASATEDAGVWATVTGWFAALSARPSLAAAMSLVVLVGIGSMVYFRGGDEIAQPNRSADTASPSPEAQRESAPAVAAPTGTVAEDPAPAAEGEAAAFEQDGLGVGGGGADPLGITDLEPTKQAPARPSKRARQKKAETKSKESFGSTRAKTTKSSSSSGGRGSGAGAKGGVKAPASPAPKPAPQPPPSANKDAFDDAPGATPPAVEAAPDLDEEEAEAPAPSRDEGPSDKRETTSKVKGLHDRAVRAAKAGDCVTARKLGGQIEALDSAYYRDVFTRDSRIKACLAR